MTDRSERARSERRSDSSARRAHAAPVIPGYRIEGILARGSSATVYRARQLAVDREVALKVLHPELAGRKRVIMRLQREARTAARLAHPHIVSAIDMGEVDGLWWFAMELVHGPSLALRLRQSGTLSEREALRLFIPICEALVHLAEHGVVHRDIKPANILIDDSGGARIADLGLAFADGDPVLTAQGGTLGTPHYISPEQAVDPSAVDGRADLWSFGATLFHAVVGHPPFQGSSLAEVLSGVLHARIPDPGAAAPHLSKGFVLVLRKCLSRDLRKRYESPSELLADLELVRERRSPRIDARALEPTERSADRGWLWGVGAAALALVAAVALWVTRDDGDSRELESTERVEARLPEELRAWRGRAKSDPALLASALADLSAYAELAPPELARDARDLESELLLELREEMRELRRSQERALVDWIEAGEFERASRALESGFDDELRERTGFAASALPGPLAKSRASWLEERVRELERARGVAISVFARAAEGHYRRVVLPAVEELLDARSYRSARRLLGRSPSVIAEAAGLELGSLAADELQTELAELRSTLRVREERLVDEWTRVEAGMHRWIDRRARELEADLQDRRLRTGAGRRLTEDFARRLEQEGLRVEEFPSPEGDALVREVGRRRVELAELEEGLLARELGERIESMQGLFDSRWRAREYETLRALWGRLESEVAELPDTTGSGWKELPLEEVRLERAQAERLADLLARAARGLVQRGGQTLELRIGNIPVKGRVELQGDPLETTFTLRTGAGARTLDLRSLATRDLLRLAALGAEPALDGADLLDEALLLFRDGQFSEALAAAALVPSGGGEQEDRIATAIERGALRALEASQEVASDRRREVEVLFEAVDAEAGGTGRLTAVVSLIENYPDSPLVRARLSELKRLRDRLTAPPSPPGDAELRAAFDPLALEWSEDGVRLVFEFGPSASAAWERGTWDTDWDAWEAPAADRDSERLLRPGPRLELRRGDVRLDVDNELDLRVDFEPGAEELLVVSLAGFHVSLAGDKSPIADARGWLVSSGSLEEHLEALRRGKGALGPLLDEGRRSRVELRFRPRSGRVRLALDGREVEASTVRAPRGGSDGSELRILAGGGGRVRRVELQAHLP